MFGRFLVRDARGWEALRRLAVNLSSVELPLPRQKKTAGERLFILTVTEALISAHRAARCDGDEALCCLIEAALSYAGRRLKSEISD